MPAFSPATRFACYPGASARMVAQPDNSFAIEGQTSPTALSYVVSLPDVFVAGTSPDYIKVCMEVIEGTVGVCLTDELARHVYSQYFCRKGDGVHTFYLDCRKMGERGNIIVRAGGENQKNTFRLLSCEPLFEKEHSELIPEIMASLIQGEARNFFHWYYDSDLGGGVVVPSTYPKSMPGIAAARQRQLGLIEKYFGDINGWRVLDAPSSAGYHSFALAEKGATVVGIDHDEHAIRQACFVRDKRKRFSKEQMCFENIDLLDFRAPDESFDLIYCSGVFYHLREHVRIAKKLYNLARRGIMMQSSIINDPRDIFILSDPAFNFCADWEFAFVPSPSMMWKIMEYVGFKDLEMYDMSEVTFDETGKMHISVDPRRDASHLPPDLGGPIYILGRK